MKSWVRLTVRAGGWAVCLAVVGVVAATVVMPRLVGGHAYAVMSGSMQPALDPGSVVVVRPIDVEDIDVGSVITFQIEPGEPGVATHRVVSQGMHDSEGPIFRTQGDANGATDRHWVRPVQVKGEVWYAVPYVGRLTALLPMTAKEVGIALIAVSLLSYALYMFVLSLRDRRAAGHA